ncbi:MAG: hypothetical protein J0I92_06520, partial [Phyllobacterium sp.]|nr:hypothetical protein [Phyllobacterium sp.]
RNRSRAEVARARLARSGLLSGKPGGQFCAIGGTWRSLAKMHQVLRDYPLHMVQHYAAKASDIARLCDDMEVVVRAELAVTAAKNLPGAAPREFVVQYVVGAYMAVLTWWLDRGAKPPPAEVDRMFRRLATDGILAHLVEGS